MQNFWINKIVTTKSLLINPKRCFVFFFNSKNLFGFSKLTDKRDHSLLNSVYQNQKY